MTFYMATNSIAPTVAPAYATVVYLATKMNVISHSARVLNKEQVWVNLGFRSWTEVRSQAQAFRLRHCRKEDWDGKLSGDYDNDFELDGWMQLDCYFIEKGLQRIFSGYFALDR